ncbi:ectopic P granules protein 5 homolog [Dermacentor andersoni]|uniref:ectopic P granules protein 5 homolog n=1 Tax=Dermacentor andersoni TaxID=34620 RepID=UPI002416EBB9|nr:ectopic P granules protein 5 homolog [Dermacentor andersoni]
MEAAATVSSREKISAGKRCAPKQSNDFPATKVGESEGASCLPDVVEDGDGSESPPCASEVSHSTTRQDGADLLPGRPEEVGRSETFDDSQQEKIKAVPQPAETICAVVLPQIVPSAPVDAPEKVHSGIHTETTDKKQAEITPAFSHDLPSAPADTGSETGDECSDWEEIRTEDLTEAPSAPPAVPPDTHDNPCAFPTPRDTLTTQTELASYKVTALLPTACGYDVFGRSRDIGRHYPEISGISDHRAAIRPLLEDQILQMYGGAWLKGRENMVANFASLNEEKNLNSHSLYVLLANYLRSRDLLSETTSLMESLREETAQWEARVWNLVSASVTGTGSCSDYVQVSGTHHFQQAKYNKDVASILASRSEQMLTLLKEKHVVYMHNVNTLRVQIDYHFQLVVSGTPFRDMQNSRPISFKIQTEPNCDVSELKSCISVLFLFLRKGSKDKLLVKDVQSWVHMLSNVLLRVASLADHFFLLNHVLLCPPGIHKWAISLVQVPSPLPPVKSDCHQMLDYALAVLATILSPVGAHKEYLRSLPKKELASVLGCLESDVVALLNQVPFIDILNFLRGTPEETDAAKMSELDVLKAIAVASHLVSILHTGLKTYSDSWCKHLSRKIARLISLTIHCMSDLLKGFQLMHNNSDPALLAHLQVEYDQLFLRAVNSIFHSCKTGAWQFMVGLPYASISAAMTWQLLWLLHNSYEENLHQVHLSPLEVCSKLLCKSHRLSFHERLSQLPHSEVFFLMTAFVNMVDSPALAHIVAIDIFEIAYLNVNLRKSLPKQGRELLSSLAQKQPFIVSVLLDAIEDHMLALGIMSCYLMRAMPLELWQPDKEDLDIIAHFLLCYPLDSPQSLLARMLIDALNYGTNEQDQLFLERSLHQFVGVLLLMSYRKFCADRVHKQVRYLPFMATSAYKSSTPTEFSSWVWDILFKLKLHAFDSNHHAQLSLVVDENPPVDVAPDLQKYEWLQPVAQATNELLPCGIFLSFSIASMGHCREQVLTTGLNSISTLVLKKQYAAAIKCLSLVLPLFYMRQEMLITNRKFLEDLQHLVLVDGTSMAAAWRLAGYEHERCVLKLLAGTMAYHVKQAKRWGFPSLPIRLWTSLLLHLPDIPMQKAASKFSGQSDVMYLLDFLVQLAYFEADCLESALEQLTTLLNSLTEQASAPLSMKTWPAVVPFDSAPLAPWFALAGMLAEARLPSVAAMWEAVLCAAVSPECTAAVKKAMRAPLDVLLLYRWARQAVVTDADHPALPLIWQQFFCLYLRKCPDGNSAGLHLFKCGGFSSLLKKVKQRVANLVDHFSKYCSGEEKGALPKILCERLLRVYRSFVFWLEDKQVLCTGVDLTALPSKYCPGLLCATIQGSGQLWHDLVSMEPWQCQLESLELAKFSPVVPSQGKQQDSNVPAVKEGMIFRLGTHEKPVLASPVPTLVPVIPPVPVVASEVRELVASQLRALRAQASTVNGQLDMLAHLDQAHQNELLPVLYKNVEAHVSLVRTCGNDCSGAAQLNLTFYEARQDPNILLKVKQNRTEWLATLTGPPHASCCALVQLEACLTQLVQRHRQASPADKIALAVLGSEVFFDLIGALQKDITSYSPTRQFLTLCLDMVGQEFVSNRASQCLPVLQAMLKNPSIVNHISPFFTPAAADDEQYALMYHSLSSSLVPALYNTVFVLLSKFDLPHWLTSRAPSRAVRGNLLVAMEMMLEKCGHSPKTTVLPLVELLCSHLRGLLQFSFPQQYAPVLTMLLKGTSSCSIPVVTWSILIQSLGRSTSGAAAHIRDMCAKHRCTLSLDEAAETLAVATAHFAELRTSDASLAMKGLYNRVKPYLSVLCHFFSVIAHAYIWKKVNSPKDNLQQAIKAVLQLYGPWLELTEDKNACAPWLPNDTDKALCMADSLVYALAFFHDCCCNVANINVMSSVWQHYFVKYVWTNPPKHITDTVQVAFDKLPWSKFSPSVEDVRLACKLLDEKYSSHLTFLVQVFVQVPWQTCLRDALQLAPEYIVDYSSSFAELVLGLAWHPNMAAFVATSLDPLREYNWGVVPVEIVWRLQKVFASSCNVHQLLKPSVGVDRTALEFVAALSCMLPGHANDLHKQLAFVTMLVGLYSSALDVADAKDLISLLPHLLGRCEHVHGPVVLLGRALSLLDCCPEGSPQVQALVEGLLPWLNARAGQPILLSVLTASCGNVASVQLLVCVTEACLAAFLKGSFTDDSGWFHAVAAFQIPELTLANFLKQCACQAAHLTQLIYVLHCLPKCHSPEDEWVLLDQLASWVSQGCANCTGGTSEPKLLLLWSKLLILSVRQLDFGSHPEAVHNLLVKFCSTLGTLGEDRDTSGLLGALGMGRRSAVSTRFRLCCRAVAAFVAARLDNNAALAEQTLSRLRSLQTSKAYLPLSQEIQAALGIVQDTSLGALRDSLHLVSRLVDSLYREEALLHILVFWQRTMVPGRV